MTNIAVFHVATVKAGQADFHADKGYSRVRHDGSTYYYDIAEMDYTADQFASFVNEAWELFEGDEIKSSDVLWEANEYCADID